MCKQQHPNQLFQLYNEFLIPYDGVIVQINVAIMTVITVSEGGQNVWPPAPGQVPVLIVRNELADSPNYFSKTSNFRKHYRTLVTL